MEEISRVDILPNGLPVGCSCIFKIQMDSEIEGESADELCQLPADVQFIEVSLNGKVELVLDESGEKELVISPVMEKLLVEQPSFFGKHQKDFSRSIPQLERVVRWESRRRTQQVIQTALDRLSNPDEYEF